MRGRRLRRVVAVAALAAGAAAYFLRGPAPRPVEGGLKRALELGRERGKPVLVIMSGVW